MKKLLTSLLLIVIVSAMLFSTVKIEPANATSLFSDDFEDGTLNKWTDWGAGKGFQIDSNQPLLSETFESWNSNAWSIFGDGTQQDETTIVHGGSHSRKFTQPYDTKIMIYKEGEYATQTSNVTFWMYLPSDLNIGEGALLAQRKVVLEIFDVVEMDFGFWNDSGTIRPYVYRAEEEWSYYIYLTNASLSLASWHSVSCTLFENDTGFVELSIDSSLVYHNDGDYWDNIYSDGTPSYYVGFPLTNNSVYTASCYIDDLTIIGMTSFVHSGIYSAEGLASLGDGMRKQLASPPTTAYLTIWIYYNGSRTNAGDVRIVTLQNTTSGRGVSVKHHLYNAGRDVLQLFDEWTGTSTNSTHDLTYNTWHKILFTVTSSNNTANLYVDDVLEASKTIALSNEVCNELDVYRDDATTGSYYYRMWIDDVDWSGEEEEPPTTYSVSFDSEPSSLFSVHFGAGGSWYWTPKDLNLTSGLQTFLIESGSLIRIVNDTWIYGFDHWSITNTTGTFNSTGSSVDYNLQEDTNVTMAYSYVTISVNASPSEVLSHVFFSDEYYGTNFAAPETLHMNSGYHTLTATIYQYYPNSSYVYTFDYWLVNGTSSVGSLAINESFTGDTTLEMVYAGSTVIPPFTHIYAAAALNATWYFRSDTHTVATVLGYRLLTTNTQTPAGYSNSILGSQDTSYGVRVWAVGFFNETYELTAGNPEVICTKVTNGSEMMIGYWNCPSFNVMTNAIKVQVYQRFGSDSWSLTRIFITSANLLYRFPASTWTFHFYVSRIETSITNSTFWHGSYTTYNTRVDLEYYKANPWDVALARLYQRNIFSFMFTPWTYWFGDVFWSILLFGCIVMGILRTGSLKLVLATLWILGGSGSILWALIPASALHIAVVMLALAMAITFFRLIRGK
jgi:hypothetical protein